MLTLRSPRHLFHHRDLHAILVIAGIDLILTVQGILHHSGSESNPFFRPMTEMGLEAMLAGIVFYVIVLCVASLVLTGDLRKILASITFGMHVVGVMTWLYVVDIHLGTAFADPMNTFYYMLGGTASTALFYFAEERYGHTYSDEDV